MKSDQDFYVLMHRCDKSMLEMTELADRVKFYERYDRQADSLHRTMGWREDLAGEWAY